VDADRRWKFYQFMAQPATEGGNRPGGKTADQPWKPDSDA
jgi:hypothetical protein